MIQERHSQQSDVSEQPKWFSSPVTFHEGTLADIGCHIPTFERRGFALTQPGNERSRLNERLDMIVRRPTRDDEDFIPIGAVSKEYTLVPHTAVLDVATTALEKAGIQPGGLKAELTITKNGERMLLSVYLPEKYDFDPGGGSRMALQLQCWNSVEGSTRFRALVGWYRFVCSNGLIVGVTRYDMRRRHVGDIRLEDVSTVLRSGLKESEAEKKNFERWRKTEITLTRLVPWIEKDLRQRWGFKAAARVFHLARSGWDVEIVGQYKDNSPTTIQVQEFKRVPGTPEQCRNLFDVSQILAWLAKERRDVQEQVEWRETIPVLMAPLMNKK